MGSWIKNNLVLVAGIVLPVLLVAGFMLLQAAPRALADPPAYDFLVASYRYDAGHPRDYHLSFEVREGRLEARARPAGDDQARPDHRHAVLFRYSAEHNAFSEIAYEVPDDLDDLAQPRRFPVDEAAGLELDTSGQSPDGYRFEYAGYRGRGGLMGELFGMGYRYDSYYVLSRDGVRFELPVPATASYRYGHNLSFIGWVTGEDDTP